MNSTSLGRVGRACYRFMASVVATFALSAHGAVPTLHASFDQGLDGAGRSGVVAASPVMLPVLVPGHSGKALKSGPLTGHVRYPTQGILREDRGSVEMWVSPVDWKPGDGKFHTFFELRGLTGFLVLYKYFENPRLLWLSTNDREHGPFQSVGRDLDWVPGSWHHLAAVWSADGLKLYVDGLPVLKTAVPADFPRQLEQWFSVGDLPWHSIRTSSSLIDELKVYDVALSDAEVLASFQGKSSGGSAAAASYDFSSEIDSASRSVVLDMALPADVGASGLRVSVELKNLLTGETRSFSMRVDGARARLELPATEVGAGEFSAAATVWRGGEKLAVRELPVEIPLAALAPPLPPLLETEQVAAKARGGAAVPPPWQAVGAAGSAYTVYGRRYDFGSGPLPDGVTSAGVQVLSGPVRVRVVRQGRELATAQQRVAAGVSPGGDKAEVSGRLSEAGAAEAGALANVSARLEFDGMLWISLDALGSWSSALDTGISVEIPVSAAVARTAHRWASGFVSDNRRFGDGQGRLDRTAFMPFYWLGNDDVGLFWFAESARGWPNGLSGDAIEVVRKGDEVRLVLNIKKPGQPAEGPLHFQFGLMATPVKPLPANWRNTRFTPAATANAEVIWPDATPESFRFYGYPQAMDNRRYAERMRDVRGAGRKALPYICPTFMATNSPEWAFMKEQWAAGIYDSSSPDVQKYGAAFGLVSPLAAGWREFLLAKTGEFHDRHGVDGIYLDNVHPYGIYAPALGLGFSREGKPQPEFPILAYREVLKSLYSDIKRRNPQSLVVAHMSGKLNIPVLSFADAYLDGEQYRGKLRDSYLELLSPEEFRIEFMGRQWGLVPVFLPEFDPATAAREAPTAELMTLVLLHDALVWPILSNSAYIDRVYRVLDDFGLDGASFEPYFGARPPAVSSEESVRMSSYCKADGRCLGVVGNTSREPASASLCIEGLAAAVTPVLMDTRSKVAVRPRGNCVDVTLLGGAHRFLSYSRAVQP